MLRDLLLGHKVQMYLFEKCILSDGMGQLFWLLSAYRIKPGPYAWVDSALCTCQLYHPLPSRKYGGFHMERRGIHIGFLPLYVPYPMDFRVFWHVRLGATHRDLTLPVYPSRQLRLCVLLVLLPPVIQLTSGTAVPMPVLCKPQSDLF